MMYLIRAKQTGTRAVAQTALWVGIALLAAVPCAAGEGPAAPVQPAAAAAPVASAAPLVSGDTVFVDVYRRPELSGVLQVDANGAVSVPYVGPVVVSGMSERDASLKVANALAAILKNPRVTMTRGAGAQAMGMQAPRSADMKTQVVQLYNSDAEAMSASLQGMTTQGGRIGFDKSSNSIIITDTPATIQNIMAALAQLDQMQSKITQVRIETKFAEVEEGAMKDLGIRWFTKSDKITAGYVPPRNLDPKIDAARGASVVPPNERVDTGTAGGGAGGTRRFVEAAALDRRLVTPITVPTYGQMFFGLMNSSIDLGALIDALVGEDKAKLLATPMAVAVNHKPAEIKMADEYPYTEAYQGVGGTNFSVNFMDVGIKMLVTPHVYKDPGGVNYVQLELNPEASFTSGMSNGVPVRSVRSANSVANVRDGQTLVIGGIVMSDEHNVEQGVPGISKVPLVGNLFKHKERSRSRNELMVFVTPTIHDSPETLTWDRMLDIPEAPAKQDVAKASADGHGTVSDKEHRGESRKE